MAEMLMDSSADERPYKAVNKVLAEFIGVALFVFIGIP
jgi:hypothetical protein